MGGGLEKEKDTPADAGNFEPSITPSLCFETPTILSRWSSDLPFLQMHLLLKTGYGIVVGDD